MTFGSLFSGIGGFDIGLERSGMKCSWQVEKDKSCLTILEKHWPNVKRFYDVSTFEKSGHGTVDLICGGFPCQDLSVAGKRAGLSGKRSGLFWEFMRIIRDFSPRWVLIENVPGLLSSNKGRDLGAVIGGLVDRGYGWAYRVLDSQYFGLAQRRKRVFIVGYLGEARRAAQVLFEPESLPWDSSPSRQARKEVACPLGGVSNGGGANGPGRTADDAGSLIAPAMRARGVGSERIWDTRGQDYVIAADVASSLCAGYAKGAGHNDGKKSGGPKNIVINTLRSESGFRERATHATLDSNNGSRRHQGVMSQTGVRRLTPVECARLQGFSDDWLNGLSDSAAYRCLGNAVSVPVAEWIGKRIMIADVEKPKP